jgi:hypothetical protein
MKKKKAPRNALVSAMSSRRAAPMRDRRKRRPKDRRAAGWYED